MFRTLEFGFAGVLQFSFASNMSLHDLNVDEFATWRHYNALKQ